MIPMFIVEDHYLSNDETGRGFSSDCQGWSTVSTAFSSKEIIKRRIHDFYRSTMKPDLHVLSSRKRFFVEKMADQTGNEGSSAKSHIRFSQTRSRGEEDSLVDGEDRRHLMGKLEKLSSAERGIKAQVKGMQRPGGEKPRPEGVTLRMAVGLSLGKIKTKKRRVPTRQRRGYWVKENFVD